MKKSSLTQLVILPSGVVTTLCDALAYDYN